MEKPVLPVSLEPQPYIEDPKKRPFCHRIYNAYSYAENVMGTTKDGRPVITNQQLKADISFCSCIAKQCALYDKDLNMCGDLVLAKSQKVLADVALQQHSETKIMSNGSNT